VTILSLAQNLNVIVTTGPAESKTCRTPQVEARSVGEVWSSTSCLPSTLVELRIGDQDRDSPSGSEWRPILGAPFNLVAGL